MFTDREIAALRPLSMTLILRLAHRKFRVTFSYDKEWTKRSIRVSSVHLGSVRYIGLNRIQRPGLKMAQIAVMWFLRDRDADGNTNRQSDDDDLPKPGRVWTSGNGGGDG